MPDIRLTTAQALVRCLGAQHSRIDGQEVPLFAGVFAIFGHGNVAGLGEALEHAGDTLPTFRAHNEQAMAHAAIAYAKASRRRRMMACTTSIGPGATNMVTAAALAHVNRLPVLLLPGDVFASRRPDPVLQQVEAFGDPTVSANDCFRPVSRFWDRITRPEQLIASLPQALSVLTDPADCGPVVLSLPQDVQAEAFTYPERLFERVVHEPERPAPEPARLALAAERIRQAKRPLVIAGGGVRYAGAEPALADFAERLSIPVAETQAGKGALRWDHALNAGAIGVTGSSAANLLAAEADLIIAVGTRLSDFTTGSNALFKGRPDVIAVNVCRFDAIKRGALPLRADAALALPALADAVGAAAADPGWLGLARRLIGEWSAAVDHAMQDRGSNPPGDAEVIGAVNRALGPHGTVVCSAGGLPGELHKLWRTEHGDGYHLEYGYSCMGYEIAGGLGVKMACPERDVVVMVGDGSYLMMNSEIATSVALGHKLVIVVLDNRGFGCIERLQQSLGGASFNNRLPEAPRIDFVAHARSLGAEAVEADDIDGLAQALTAALTAERTSVVVIETDPLASTEAGGAWWDVPVAETSASESVRAAHAAYRRVRDGDAG